MIFYGSKADVVQFATDLQKLSESAWESTTITRMGTSAAYSVSIATDTLSDDIVKEVAMRYSLRPTTTSDLNTLGGSFPRKL